MKILKYITLIALMICNIPSHAMNALQRKQAAVAAAQEKKAVSTVQKFRIRKKQTKSPKEQPISGPGIKRVEVFTPLALEKNSKGEWYPTTDALTKLLNEHVPLKGGLVVENSTEQGARNIALFVAYRNAYTTTKGLSIEKRPLFFLKISRSDLQGISDKLDKLQKGPVGEFNLKALSDRELPIVLLQEMFFIYKGNDNKNYTIEVMHLAHGKMVNTLIDDHNENDQQWAAKIGKALGLFHLEFMNYNNSSSPKNWTTMAHGDFHMGNVFFDEKGSRVYFIDNSDMHIDNPFKDLEFLNKIANYGFDEALDAERPEGKKKNTLNFILAFIKGYLSAYPLKTRGSMAAYIKEKLKPAYDQLAYARRPARKKIIGDFIGYLDRALAEASGQ